MNELNSECLFALTFVCTLQSLICSAGHNSLVTLLLSGMSDTARMLLSSQPYMLLTDKEVDSAEQYSVTQDTKVSHH